MSDLWDDVLVNFRPFLLVVLILLFIFFICYLLCYLQSVSRQMSCYSAHEALFLHGSRRSLVEVEEDLETDNTAIGIIPFVRRSTCSQIIEMERVTNADTEMQSDSFFQLPSDKRDTFHRFSLVDDGHDLGKNEENTTSECEDLIAEKMPCSRSRSLQLAEFGPLCIKGIQYKRPCDLLLNNSNIIRESNLTRYPDELNQKRCKEVLI